MNHKRHRPKSSRAGCLLCKPHKLQRGKNGRERRAMTDTELDRLEAVASEAMTQAQGHPPHAAAITLMAAAALAAHAGLSREIFLAQCTRCFDHFADPAVKTLAFPLRPGGERS